MTTLQLPIFLMHTKWCLFYDTSHFTAAYVPCCPMKHKSLDSFYMPLFKALNTLFE